MKKVIIPLCAVLCLWSAISSAEALIFGIAITLVFGNAHLVNIKKNLSKWLSWAVIGLGAGMNLKTVAEVGLHGLGYTAIGITLALSLGWLFGKWLGQNTKISHLISVGTAICGGSAIAAVAPVLNAEGDEISVSLGVVFLFNSLALIIFPPIGHHFGLSQAQFGLWSALAIHDTSSVVGAALQYGNEALTIATTTKLARALWIVPVTFLFGYLYRKQSQTTKTKKPWFILGFLIMAAIATYIPETMPATQIIYKISQRALVVILFLIGSTLTLESLKKVGIKPFLQGALLWVSVLSLSLIALVSHLIQP